MRILYKLTLISVLFCVAFTTGKAEEKLSMLEEGMKWSCANLDHSEDAEPLYFSIEVKGDTIVGGRKCKKLIKINEDGTDRRIHCAYEENGIVYHYLNTTSRFCPYLDFNLETEDWVDCYDGDGQGCGNMFQVGACGYVNIHGVNRKVLAMGYISEYYLPYVTLWIEGIGAMYEGTTKIRYPSHGDIYIMLECTKNGECLFKREDLGDISSQLLNGEPIIYEPLINYDRVWECIVREDNGDIHVDYLRFEDSEVLMNQVYTRVVNFASLEEHIDNAGGSSYSVSDVAPSTFGFMREKDSEVFTVIDEESMIYTGEDNSYPAEESMIYKFNIARDDLFNGVTFKKDRLQYGRFRVRSQMVQTINGEKNRKSFLYFHEDGTPFRSSPSFSVRQFIAEGIGTGYYGCLCRPELDAHRECSCFSYFEQFGEEYPVHNCYGRELPKYMTNRVFDKNGNVIYTSPRCNLDIPYQLAVSKVNSCNSDSEWMITARKLQFTSVGKSLELTIYSKEGVIYRNLSGSDEVECILSDFHSGIYIAIAKHKGMILSTKKIYVK